ncbi:nucleotidyltransferase family protein [Mucilaginibacter sp.]
MTALIILAAGESSRMGQPKQNLIFNGLTLLQLAVETGIKSACEPIVVVLGANADNISSPANVKTIYNKHWKEGMASSIRSGINEIMKDEMVDKTIILLCDQPFADEKLLSNLVSKQAETNKLIIASEYNGIAGVPALFERAIFNDLLKLQGHEGAKKIIQKNTQFVDYIPFEKGSIDIDTPEDYERLKLLND